VIVIANNHLRPNLLTRKTPLLILLITVLILFVLPGQLHAMDAPYNAEKESDEEESSESGTFFGERKNPGTSTFPLLKHLVPKEQWDQLPRPYCIAYFYHSQSQWYSMTRVNLGGIEVPSNVLDTVNVNSITHSHGIKGDLWLFPFLNLYLHASYTTGSANVYVLTPTGIPQDVALEFDVTAFAFGPGMTLAFGYANFFLTASLSYAVVLRPGADTSSNAAFTGMFGYNFPVFNIWIGGMYSDTAKNQGGYLGDVRYDVVIEAEAPWSLILGMRFSLIRQRLDLVIQQGFGERISSTMNLTWRLGE
jgi:hypothetical protein